MNNFFAQKYNAVLGTLVLVAVFGACTAYAYLTIKQASDWSPVYTNTISVTGTGEATATPDVATFSFSVTAKGADATAAQTASAEKMNAILALLKEKEIADADIKTEGYNMYPNYRYENVPCPLDMYCPGSEPVEDGFEVSQTVTVKVRDTEIAGELLSGVGTKGATNISGLTFTVDSNDAQKIEARRLAIADAQVQAELLAEQLGITLGDMVSYYEEPGYGNPYYGGYAMDTMSAKAEMAPSIPVGESTTKSTVTLMFEIR